VLAKLRELNLGLSTPEE